jgi:hypothetical protein
VQVDRGKKDVIMRVTIKKGAASFLPRNVKSNLCLCKSLRKNLSPNKKSRTNFVVALRHKKVFET